MGGRALRIDAAEAIYKPIFSRAMPRPLIACRVQAGFPSPAEDYIEGGLDLAKHLVKRPMATFYILVVVDRSCGVQEGHLIEI